MDALTAIDTMIEERHLLGHPFYRRWVAGTLPREALQDYTRQYYAFESSFPRFLSAIHSRCEDLGARQTILDNLWDEEHGEDNHAELWLRFAEGMGVPRKDVLQAERNPATRALVGTYRKVTSEEPVEAGIAAVYAYERQVPAVAAAKLEGLQTHYGVDDARTVTFWQVHRALDDEHAAGERTLLLAADNDEVVLRATETALTAWWRFLDDVDPGTLQTERTAGGQPNPSL